MPAPDTPTAKRDTTVVVGMSGGVDSSVSAYLLKAEGYRVVGMFMKNWEEKDENGVCTSEADYQDVIRVCEHLEIPYYGVEYVAEYRDRVFARFLEEYRRGYTPNPDVLCNREIKFGVFMQKALGIGAEYLATGHYTQIGRSEGRPALCRGADPGKDQSYFLHSLSAETLERVLFPIGHLAKDEVRRIAREQGLITYDKKDSTGICFIGERDFRKFLSGYLPAQPGSFIDLDHEKEVGRHYGSAYYTLGQRRGLGLGGEGEAWYVVAKDMSQNRVFVSRGAEHPALYADYLEATEVTWVDGAPPTAGTFHCTAKARYRQPDQGCTVTPKEDGGLRVDFDVPQRALTPGQSVVFYRNEFCLGGGVIDRIGPTYYERGITKIPVSALG